ncbi:MAG TPA: penicillin-binding protein 2 [Nitrospirota bacterium]
MPRPSSDRPGFRRRALVVALLLALGFAGVACRLVYLQVVMHGELSAAARRQHNKVVDIPARRGSVLDREGRELAVSLDSKSLYGIPSRVEDPDRVARKLAPIIGMPVRAVARKLTGEKSFVWLSRQSAPDVPTRVAEAGGFDGMIGWIDDSRRYYPDRELAAHVIGFTGMDNEGLEGIEAMYQREVGGSPGKAVTKKDGRGREVFEAKGSFVQPERGSDVVLTLDEKIQYIVEKELDRLMREYRPVSASAIVMDPRTGEVLAMANRPAYNPNSWRDYPQPSWRNRAVADIYEPGSTFKIVTAAAAIEEHVISPGDRIYCGEGKIEVGGRVIHDAHKLDGSIKFSEVIQKSSNVGTIKVALMLGQKKLHDYACRFGFGVRTGVDLPGEAGGMLRDEAGWSGVSIASIAIGQEVGVTPLQMLCAMNAIANDGVRMTPYAVSAVIGPDGVRKDVRPRSKGERVVSGMTASKLKDILCTVVEEGGTAVEANVKGYKVAGKTGTAQKYDPAIRRYSRDKYASSFVGFVPADDPKISVIVVVNEPKGEIYGGLVAAPAFRAIAEQTMSYMRVPTRLPEQVILVER